MTKILGKAEATAEQMAAYLLSQNPNPKINMPLVEFCQMFLDEGAKEGARGDGLFAQSCWETNDFRYTGTVTPDQNNYAGLGTVNASTKGAYFKDEAEGILAQAQHAKTYATKDDLNCECVDPRRTEWFVKAKGGTAEHWEQLGGSWAVPGYDTKKYSSLEEANKAKDSYGYKIINILNDILAKPKSMVESEKRKMVINVHAGHNPDGKAACGAVGLMKESTENRKVAAEVIAQLRGLGHTVYDCTVNDGINANDVLKKIVAKCNTHDVDFDISIHFNAGAGDLKGNGITTGTESFIYSDSSKAKPYAQQIARNIAALGFKLRDDAVKDDVKNANYLYVLKNTKAPAILVECCFVDDADDIALYDVHSMASAIVKGITGTSYTPAEDTKEDTTPEPERKVIYRVYKQEGAYSIKENADKMKEKLQAEGFNAIIVEV